MAGRIFISYRREDTRGFSLAIFNYLATQFGADEIFMDVDSIAPGRDFVKVLEDAVDACDVLIALIGRDWLTLKDASGIRRLDNPEDFVRVEISRALERGVRVLPLLVDGALHLKSSDLPHEIKKLARLHAFTISDYFHADMKRLLPTLRQYLEEAEARRAKQVKEQEQSELEKQGEIDGLLDQAREALEHERWTKARQQAQAVLILEPNHIKAQVIMASAEAGAKLAQEAAEEQARREAAEKAATEQAEKKRKEKEEQVKKAEVEKEKVLASLPSAQKKLAEKEKPRENASKPAAQGWQLPELVKLKSIPPQTMHAGVVFISILIVIGIIWGLSSLIGGGTPNIPQAETSTHTAEPSLIVGPAVTSTITPTNTHTPEPLPTYTKTPEPTPTPDDLIINQVDGAPYVYIPAGEFLMGPERGDSDEQTVHSVYLDAFWIGQTEVTNGLFKQCVEAGVCEEPICSYYGDESYNDHPVVCVDWQQAQTYCEWTGGKLPTEAEWEKAARGGLEGKLYPWGDERPICKLGAENGAQYDLCVGQTASVGSFAPNRYGLYDMAGNVWEWTADWFDAGYYFNSPYENPTGPDSGTYRVIRGGYWTFNSMETLAIGNRGSHNPDGPYQLLGFRCVVDGE